MGWRRRDATSARAARRTARTDAGRPDLLEVWSDPQDAPAAAGIRTPPHTEPVPLQDAAQWRRPLAVVPGRVDAGTGTCAVAGTAIGEWTCIRLNCCEQGRPTDAARCPVCGHRTARLRDCRWPRSS